MADHRKRPRIDAVTEEEPASKQARLTDDDLLDSGAYKHPPGNPQLQSKKIFFNRKNLSKAFEHVLPEDRQLIDSYLFDMPITEFDLKKMDLQKLRDTVEPVSRAHEESYLREATGNERACINGSDCEGHFVQSGGPGFTLREFLLPSQEASYQRTKVLPTQRYMCLLCQRNKVAEQFFMIKASGRAMKSRHILQNFCNIVGVPNEYVLEDTILSSVNKWEGIVAPIVMHNRKNYRFRDHGGIKHLDQLYGLPFSDRHFLTCQGKM